MSNKVYVVGLGPGGIEQMTTRAINVLKQCDVIAGYHVTDTMYAGYPHMHLWGNIEFAKNFINACAKYKKAAEQGDKKC